MSITQIILNIALIGGDPVLYILVLMSIITVAVIVERFISYKDIEKHLGI